MWLRCSQVSLESVSTGHGGQHSVTMALMMLTVIPHPCLTAAFKKRGCHDNCQMGLCRVWAVQAWAGHRAAMLCPAPGQQPCSWCCITHVCLQPNHPVLQRVCKCQMLIQGLALRIKTVPRCTTTLRVLTARSSERCRTHDGLLQQTPLSLQAPCKGLPALHAPC